MFRGSGSIGMVASRGIRENNEDAPVPCFEVEIIVICGRMGLMYSSLPPVGCGAVVKISN